MMVVVVVMVVGGGADDDGLCMAKMGERHAHNFCCCAHRCRLLSFPLFSCVQDEVEYKDKSIKESGGDSCCIVA